MLCVPTRSCTRAWSCVALQNVALLLPKSQYMFYQREKSIERKFVASSCLWFSLHPACGLSVSIMLELEFKQVQDGMDVLVRMSFLNTSLFAPTERQNVTGTSIFNRLPKAISYGKRKTCNRWSTGLHVDLAQHQNIEAHLRCRR